ncbi:hypothetical protein ABFS82_03G009100 [Erythranthe guttata]
MLAEQGDSAMDRARGSIEIAATLPKFCEAYARVARIRKIRLGDSAMDRARGSIEIAATLPKFCEAYARVARIRKIRLVSCRICALAKKKTEFKKFLELI